MSVSQTRLEKHFLDLAAVDLLLQLLNIGLLPTDGSQGPFLAAEAVPPVAHRCDVV